MHEVCLQAGNNAAASYGRATVGSFSANFPILCL